MILASSISEILSDVNPPNLCGTNGWQPGTNSLDYVGQMKSYVSHMSYAILQEITKPG